MRRAKEKFVAINGVIFELYDDGRLDNTSCLYGANYDEIYYAYGRPSSTKVESWESWCDWAYECNQKGIYAGLRIGSHCFSMYSIYGEVRTEDGTKYELWITRDHNRAFRTHKPTA